jgi:hypothetical protein
MMLQVVGVLEKKLGNKPAADRVRLKKGVLPIGAVGDPYRGDRIQPTARYD